MKLIALLAALTPAAFSQSVDIVLQQGQEIPGIGVVSGFTQEAVNDSGRWAAGVFGRSANGTFGGGLVVDGVLVQATGSPLAGGGTFNGPTSLFIDGAGRVAYGGVSDTSTQADVALVDTVEVLRAGDDSGSAGTTWNDFRLVGFADDGTVFLSGDVTMTATGDLLDALGFVRVDVTGAVVARGLVALEGQPLPGGLGNFVGSIRDVAVSANGNIIWVGRRDSGNVQTDHFLLLDSTVLAIEGSPSPLPGGAWFLNSGEVSISPSGNHWSIVGWLSGPPSARRFAVVVDGALEYGDGDAVAGFAPNTFEDAFDAQVDDDGSLFWYGLSDRLDGRFGTGFLVDEDVVFRPGVDLVGGARHSIQRLGFSGAGEQALSVLNDGSFVTLARLDPDGAPLGCGAGVDPYEPNDDCSSSTVLPDVVLTTAIGVSVPVSRTDDDWYHLTVDAGDVLHVRALHAAIGGEVDLELYTGPCGSQTLVQSATQATPNEGFYVNGPAAGTAEFDLRVFVPQDSVSDCVEYRLIVGRQPERPCTGPGEFIDDALEPNDSCSDPVPIEVGVHSDLAISRMAPDYFQYTIAPGGAVRFSYEPPGPNIGTRFEVLEGGCSGERIGLFQNNEAIASNPGTEPMSVVLRVQFPDNWTFNGPQCINYGLVVEALGDGVGYPVCSGNGNSTGGPATIAAYGSDFTIANLLEVRVNGLPEGTTGFFLASRLTDTITPGNSQGTLCLGSPIGRALDSIQSADFGRAAWRFDLTSIPQPMGAVSVIPGERWNFQMWYRDANPMATSNFSGAVGVWLR